MNKSLKALEEKIGHHFGDKDLLHTALTHSSTGHETNYERLEFLGDRVLGLVVAQLLYEKFPEENEGDLAKRLASLVQGSMLAQMATQIELGDYIHFSEAERSAGGNENDNILADVFESLIGALYLESGLRAPEKLIHELWSDVLDTMIAPPQHPKTGLQEWAQGQSLPLPVYEIVSQSGPDHAPVFDIKLEVRGFDPIVAQGRTRQEAEKEVAREFLKKIKKD
ncbi:MAG: ribonuclease 3 [Micavibrio sp.]|nr:MAG: ribonuclease 3 [Micavibrio sp.]